MMQLNTAGTPALEDIDDDDWTVNRITNQQIKISAPGPDTVMFIKIPQETK